jgi:MSHA biogenesis protein MshJ
MHNKLQERFSTLSLREKIVVIAVFLAALGSGWDYFFYQSILQRQYIVKEQWDALNVQKTRQKPVVLTVNSPDKIDPNSDNQKKLLELKAQYDQQQQQIQLYGNKNFVPASLMAKVLSDILRENKHLTLSKFETLSPIPLLEMKQGQRSIYKHELVVLFKGNFSDTVTYLKALEALSWVIVWESIDYQVKDYPLAEISIHFVIFGFDRDWLGV